MIQAYNKRLNYLKFAFNDYDKIELGKNVTKKEKALPVRKERVVRGLEQKRSETKNLYNLANESKKLTAELENLRNKFSQLISRLGQNAKRDQYSLLNQCEETLINERKELLTLTNLIKKVIESDLAESERKIVNQVVRLWEKYNDEERVTKEIKYPLYLESELLSVKEKVQVVNRKRDNLYQQLAELDRGLQVNLAYEQYKENVQGKLSKNETMEELLNKQIIQLEKDISIKTMKLNSYKQSIFKKWYELTGVTGHLKKEIAKDTQEWNEKKDWIDPNNQLTKLEEASGYLENKFDQIKTLLEGIQNRMTTELKGILVPIFQEYYNDIANDKKAVRLRKEAIKKAIKKNLNQPLGNQIKEAKKQTENLEKGKDQTLDINKEQKSDFVK